MRQFSATELANRTGDVLAAAARSAVEIQRHGKPRFVLLSVERFHDIVSRGDTRRTIHVDDMTDADADALVAVLEKSIENDG